jgi:hypothetical protein
MKIISLTVSDKMTKAWNLYLALVSGYHAFWSNKLFHATGGVR